MQLIHNKTRLCEGASRLVAEAHDPPFFTSTKMKFSRWGGELALVFWKHHCCFVVVIS